MAGDNGLNLQSLEKPDKAHDVSRRDDCISCKLVGKCSQRHDYDSLQLLTVDFL